MNYKRRCFTCEHWLGDRQEQAEAIEKSPLCMEIERGWPKEGGCSEQFLFSEIEIDGNASVSVLFNANFGCIHWKPNE